MSALLLVVAIAFVTSLVQKDKYERRQDDSMTPGSPEVVESIVVPRLDPSVLEGRIRDARPEDRVLLDAEAVEGLLTYTQNLSAAHYGALGVRTLDPAATDELLTDPEAHRGDPYRARGYVVDVVERTRPAGGTSQRGTLRTDDGRYVHFVTSRLPEGMIADDFVRMDGLFLQLYRRELPEGWQEGPLLVGARMVRSYPRAEDVDRETLLTYLDDLTDDDATTVQGLTGEVYDAQWKLIAYSLAHGDEVDWESAPVLDNTVMTDVLKNGAAHRGEPFRIPVSKNMGLWTRDPGENPARVDTVTTGWIGNWTWTNHAGVLNFVMPGGFPEVENSELVEGRGYFLKNFAYEPKNGGVRVAPYFVLESLEVFQPQEEFSIDFLLYGMVGITVLLVLLIPFLLIRDRRKSAALQHELLRRRQERRRRTEGTEGALLPVSERRLRVATAPAYEVRIGRGLLAAVAEAAGDRPVVVLTDETVERLHGARLTGLERAPRVVVAPGEGSKSFATLERVLEALADAGLDRRSRLVALGGGVVGDLGGLAASLYMRGIEFVQCPTTLLSQVDSSVGGKTAVNLRAGKNLAGTFHQPRAVLADVDTLATLSEEEYASGLGEVLKTALLEGGELLALLEARADELRARAPEVLVDVVARCVATKAAVVARDEREAGPRKALNLGHTFAHGIEHAAGYGTVPHGVAVAVGLRLAAEYARRCGAAEDATLPERVARLLSALGLPAELAALRARVALPAEALLEGMRHDKKGAAGVPRLVLLERPGAPLLDVEAEPALLRELLA